MTRLRRLVELSTTLNSTLKLNDILQLIIQTAAEILECEAASILLHDEGSENLFFATSTGSDAEKLAEIQVPINDSLAGTIFRTNEPLILNQIEGDARHNTQASEHVGFQTRSLLGVPMRIRTKTTGVLEALNKKDGIFTEADKNILIVVASHAAVAIHNAQLVQALRKAYETAQQADKMKSDFLAVASHELRTPLGIIIGYSTFLREEAQGELSSHAKHVLDAAMQMRALVEDMTNLTLLETDAQINKREFVPVQQVLEIAFDEIQELARAKGQVFDFDFCEEPLIVSVDIKKLSTAFANIMNNAVRFSDMDTVVRIGAKREGDEILC
ncbi:MAG: GAF domain-containing protein [Anaerolineales bacterium]|nr:GAF domain-containing protein [Anaerolineales bacterium]